MPMKRALLTCGGAHGEGYVIFSGVCDDAGALSSPNPNALPLARSQRRDILASRADISPSPVGAFAPLAALIGGLSLPLYAMVSFCNTTAQARRGFGGRVSGNVGRGTARIPRRDDALRRRVWKSPHRGSGRELSRPRWRGGLPHRSQRLRQINSAQHRLGSLLAERGRGLRRRRARGRAKRPCRLHAAEGSAAALAHRARERDVRCRDPAPCLGGTQAARARAAGKLQPGRVRRSLPAPIVGRHAPTRGARAYARGRPVRAPARRAVLGGRRADPDGAAARAGADPRTRRQDRAADHARPARSRHAVRPRAGDEPPAGPRHRRDPHRAAAARRSDRAPPRAESERICGAADGSPRHRSRRATCGGSIGVNGNSSLVRRGTAASVALLIVVLAAWQWGPGLLGIPTFIIPPLSAVFDEFLRMLAVSALMTHTGVTALEVIAGFLLGSLLGAFFGYVLGMSPTAEFALSPYILALQIAPKVAFAPLFILWMGFTLYPKILVAILIVFFPVMVNILTAIRTVDPDLVNLARAFKATRGQIFWKIEFPASLPPLFAGLRIASTLAVVGVVVGELVGGNLGLGYLLAFGEGQANTAMVFVAILMLTVVGGIAYLAVILTEQRVLHYLPARNTDRRVG